MSNKLDNLIQSEFNCNVAFYIHLKEFNQNVEMNSKKELVKFSSSQKVWIGSFDSFGIGESLEKRRTWYFRIFYLRAAEVERLKKLFMDEFKDYSNAIKISCSVAKYQKTCEEFSN